MRPTSVRSGEPTFKGVVDSSTKLKKLMLKNVEVKPAVGEYQSAFQKYESYYHLIVPPGTMVVDAASLARNGDYTISFDDPPRAPVAPVAPTAPIAEEDEETRYLDAGETFQPASPAPTPRRPVPASAGDLTSKPIRRVIDQTSVTAAAEIARLKVELAAQTEKTRTAAEALAKARKEAGESKEGLGAQLAKAQAELEKAKSEASEAATQAQLQRVQDQAALENASADATRKTSDAQAALEAARRKIAELEAALRAANEAAQRELAQAQAKAENDLRQAKADAASAADAEHARALQAAASHNRDRAEAVDHLKTAVTMIATLQTQRDVLLKQVEAFKSVRTNGANYLDAVAASNSLQTPDALLKESSSEIAEATESAKEAVKTLLALKE